MKNPPPAFICERLAGRKTSAPNVAKDCFFMRAGFLGGLANGHGAFHFEALRLLVRWNISRTACTITLLGVVLSASAFAWICSQSSAGKHAPCFLLVAVMRCTILFWCTFINKKSQWGVLPIRRFLLTSAWTLGLRAKIYFSVHRKKAGLKRCTFAIRFRIWVEKRSRRVKRQRSQACH